VGYESGKLTTLATENLEHRKDYEAVKPLASEQLP
jgi:hypothetical protein